ncbi:MAG: hypothetical protein HY952_06085, partial [Elusimicrobia bacterium]|nr:hypothetical protein [Elusimicrobiota bacterium]
MKLSLVLLFCLAALPSSSSASPDKTLVSAREALLSPSIPPSAVLLKYSETAKKSLAAPVTAEYAYALAYAGVAEGALYNLDRALITEPLSAEVRFYAAEVLNAFGLAAASDEIAAPVPAWLKVPVKLPALDL